MLCLNIKGVIVIVRGFFWFKLNYGWLDGLLINKLLSFEIKERINIYIGELILGYFFNKVEKGVRVWWYGDRNSKKYIL